jgi:diketogulonate reductase-like aldo/keto reductase
MNLQALSLSLTEEEMSEINKAADEFSLAEEKGAGAEFIL